MTSTTKIIILLIFVNLLIFSTSISIIADDDHDPWRCKSHIHKHKKFHCQQNIH